MSVQTGTFTGLKITTKTNIGDGSDQDFDGWYCIKTDRWSCPICKIAVHFATTNHRIIVFPDIDDKYLLELAEACKKAGRNPNIVEYKKEFGPCISYYNFEFMEHR